MSSERDKLRKLSESLQELSEPERLKLAARLIMGVAEAKEQAQPTPQPTARCDKHGVNTQRVQTLGTAPRNVCLDCGEPA